MEFGHPGQLADVILAYLRLRIPSYSLASLGKWPFLNALASISSLLALLEQIYST
jgi:hypothetical protein